MTQDTTITDELKACPFCGGSDLFVERADFSSSYVICNDCGARGPSWCNENDDDVAAEDAGMEPGENAARRHWNTRPKETPTEQGEEARYGWTFYGPDGEWHWSAEPDNHEAVTDQRPATSAEAQFAASLSHPVSTNVQVVELAANAIRSYLFGACQPDRGDVFSWCDDHAEQIAEAALSTITASSTTEGG